MSSFRLAITADDAAAIRKLVAPGDRGLIAVDVCPLCAIPAWRSTRTDAPDGVEATLADTVCTRCTDFSERHPAVFRWITVVLEGQNLLKRWCPPKDAQ